MDAMKTHGAFSWSELSTSDPKAATEFYGSLFGWKFETMDMAKARTMSSRSVRPPSAG